jgi:predicted NUDIX family NTP pyrophosphohydrolase
VGARYAPRMVTRSKHSAGLLLFTRVRGEVEVLLAHPGGPFFARKDEGAWSIPKGELEPGEEPEACALREFEEETGMCASRASLIALGSIRQRGGKTVEAWAFEADWQPGPMRSNTFSMEWPPRSGRMQEFPEIDRLELFSLAGARNKLNAAQVEFLDRLERHLSAVTASTDA